MEASRGREFELSVGILRLGPFLEPSLGPFRGLLGASWAVLGLSWAVWGPSSERLKPFWGDLGGLRAVLERPVANKARIHARASRALRF